MDILKNIELIKSGGCVFNKLFNKRVNETRRQKVLEQITKNCEPSISFYVMTAISAIIVALGLVMNNTTVIIGGMIIAPIFWPIIGIALSITRGSVYSFKKSVTLLFKSLAVAVILVLIFILIYPLKDEPGVEVLSRSTPQLFDLVIALFSGIAGAFAIIWPGVSSSLAGILIATTLMPAIGVMGYGIATGDLKITYGALLLFLTNLIAIIFSALVVLFFFGFRSIKTPKAKEFLSKELTWTIILLLLITIPLSYSLYSTVIINKYEKSIKKILISDIPDLKESEINSIIIDENKNYLDVKVTLATKYNLTSYEADQIVDNINSKIDKSVKLKIISIPINIVEGS